MAPPNTPYSTVGGYGGNASVVQQPSGLTSFLDDALDGYPTLHPSLNPNGSLSPVVIDPSTISAASGLPEINAVLVELRVISNLIQAQGIGGGNSNGDQLSTLRNDQAFELGFVPPVVPGN